MSTTIATRIARYIAMPVAAAAVVGATALGLAGAANAADVSPQTQTGIVAVPMTKATPATNATPGNWWHRHHPSLLDPTSAANFIAPGA